MTVALALAILLWAAPPPSVAPDPQDAAAEFDRGTLAFEAGDYAGALAAFERAQALVPHDRVRANIAMCLAKLGRTREAIAELEAALVGSELDDAERGIVQAQITTLRAELPAPAPPIAEPVPPPRPTIAPRPPDRPPPARAKPSALMWTGIPLALLGTAGTIGFGIRTQQHHEAYVAMPDDDTRSRGVRTRALTNASIAVLSLGAALVLSDVVRMAVRGRADRRSASARARRRSGMM